MCYSVHDERKVFSPLAPGFFRSQRSTTPLARWSHGSPRRMGRDSGGSERHGAFRAHHHQGDAGGSIPSPSHIAGASASAGSRSQAGGDDFSAPAQEVEPSGGGERGGGPHEFSALGPQIHSDTGPGDDSTGTSHLPRDGGPIAFIAGLFAAGQR